MTAETTPYTFEEFKAATGNHSKARDWWHLAVRFQPDRYRITRRDALRTTLSAASIVTAAHAGSQRLGMTRSDYVKFVDAVNAMPSRH